MLGPAPTSSPLRDARHVTESVRLNHLWRAQGPRKVERAGLGNVASRCRHVPPTWGGANLGSATGPRPNLCPAPSSPSCFQCQCMSPTPTTNRAKPPPARLLATDGSHVAGVPVAVVPDLARARRVKDG
jgi:hypothetical protein